MSPEDQRIAIAKACGNNPSRFTENDITGLCEMDETGTLCIAIIPDYLNDLNAMHEAEKIISNHKKQRFVDHLEVISCGKNPCNRKWRLLNASAAQRAEAFLKTLGLWE